MIQTVRKENEGKNEISLDRKTRRLESLLKIKENYRKYSKKEEAAT